VLLEAEGAAVVREAGRIGWEGGRCPGIARAGQAEGMPPIAGARAGGRMLGCPSTPPSQRPVRICAVCGRPLAWRRKRGPGVGAGEVLQRAVPVPGRRRLREIDGYRDIAPNMSLRGITIYITGMRMRHA